MQVLYAPPHASSKAVRERHGGRGGAQLTTLVGAGKAIVTPAHPVTLSGFAARTQVSQGVADQLYARALALGGERPSAPALVVSIDAIGVDSAFTAALRARLADIVPPERVAVVASHTHGGPALLDGAELGEVDPGVRRGFLLGAEAAARQAVAAMASATLHYDVVTVPGLARNRRAAAGPVDDELTVLWAERGEGEVVALLASFALHPVVLGPDNLLITRDYVGYVVDGLEAAFPGALALFATGCAGQINHGHGAEESFALTASSKRTYAVAQAIGRRLAQAAEAAVHQRRKPALRTPSVSVARDIVQLPLSRHSELGEASGAATPELLSNIELALREAHSNEDHAAVALLEPQVRWAKLNSKAPPSEAAACRSTEVMALGLGELVIALLPGEPFVEYGLNLKARIVACYPSVKAVIPVGYANDAPGYLPTAAAVAEGGYEVDLAYRFYGLPSRYSEGVESALEGAAARLVKLVIR